MAAVFLAGPRLLERITDRVRPAAPYSSFEDGCSGCPGRLLELVDGTHEASQKYRAFPG